MHDGLATLQRTATAPDAISSLQSAVTFAAQLADMDARVQKALHIGDLLMASDTIFSEGEQAAANLSRQVDIARNQELAGRDQVVASVQRRQALAVGGAALAGVFVLVLLAIGEVEPTRAAGTEQGRLALATAADEPASDTERPSDDFRNLRLDGADSVALKVSPPAGPDLEGAAALCAEIARLDSSSGLPMLLERVASLLDASGVVLWAAAEGGAELRPALSHGYSPQMVGKMASIPRDANNVTAAAFRTEQVQIATGDTVGNGAIAVPLLSPEGCAGVLTAEMRGGGESNPALRSLASIFASQFGSVLGTAPASSEGGDVAEGGER